MYDISELFYMLNGLIKQLVKEKESQKVNKLNPLVMQDIEKKDTNVRKPLFTPVTDTEGMSKEVADLSHAVK